MSSWYKTEANNDIAVSSRIRIARNIKGIPFPARMNETQKADFLAKAKDILDGATLSKGQKLKFFDVLTLPEEELASMVERHTVSPDFVKKQGARGLVLSDDEEVSVMLLEEDHIRIQVILGGLELSKAYELAAEIENILAEKMEVAFSPKLGFLTECPTNLGTGLRASVMLHLPVLESAGSVNSLSEQVSKIGLTVRGMYGEGTRSHAGLYQLSNQVTLGISENDAIENLKTITLQIIGREETARGQLDNIVLEDMVFRALGTLKYARKITSEEGMKLISLVKLGTSLGILGSIPKEIAMELLVETQPASLQKTFGRMTPEDRDICRAKFIRERLSAYEI